MDTELDERIDRVYPSANSRLPDRRELKRLSDDFSVDFAALYFADQIDSYYLVSTLPIYLHRAAIFMTDKPDYEPPCHYALRQD